jgi:hypothetical protein
MPVIVQNDPVITFPVDVKVSVVNKNPEKSVLRFDGYDHEFPPNEAVILDTETAFALFAMDTRTPPGHVIKIRRDEEAGRTGTGNSFYDECLVKYGAANTAQGRAWFRNFEGKLVKSTKKMTRDEWEKLK